MRRKSTGITTVLIWLSRALFLWLLIWTAWLYIKWEWIM